MCTQLFEQRNETNVFIKQNEVYLYIRTSKVFIKHNGAYLYIRTTNAFIHKLMCKQLLEQRNEKVY